MSIRTLLLTAAIGFAGFGTASAEPATPHGGDGHGSGGGGGSNFLCVNQVASVLCNGTLAILPVNVNISNIDALNNDELNLLSNNLNNLSLLDGGKILSDLAILNGAKFNVEDVLSQIGITGSQVNACTTLVLGLQLCSNK